MLTRVLRLPEGGDDEADSGTEGDALEFPGLGEGIGEPANRLTLLGFAQGRRNLSIRDIRSPTNDGGEKCIILTRGGNRMTRKEGRRPNTLGQTDLRRVAAVPDRPRRRALSNRDDQRQEASVLPGGHKIKKF